MNKLQRSMAGLPTTHGRKITNPKTRKTGPKNAPVILPNVYAFLMDILAPIPICHNSPHSDMIKNVVLSEVKEKINVVYNSGSN